MISDEYQVYRMRERREKFNTLCDNFKIDSDDRGRDYFIDIVDELSIAQDLAKGIVDLNTVSGIDAHSLNRMYRVGSILNKDEISEEQMEVVYDYMDSCFIEYGKVLYEVGLVEFKRKIKNIVDTLYDDLSIYDGILDVTDSLNYYVDKDIKNKKGKKKKKSM